MRFLYPDCEALMKVREIWDGKWKDQIHDIEIGPGCYRWHPDGLSVLPSNFVFLIFLVLLLHKLCLFLVALVSRRLHAVAELYPPPNIYITCQCQHSTLQLANLKKTIRDMCFKSQCSLLSFWRGFCLAPSQSGCHWVSLQVAGTTWNFRSCRHRGVILESNSRSCFFSLKQICYLHDFWNIAAPSTFAR